MTTMARQRRRQNGRILRMTHYDAARIQYGREFCRFTKSEGHTGAMTHISSLPFLPSAFPTLSFPFPLSHPLYSAIAPPAGPGERYSSPSGSGQSPAATRIFVQFTAQNLQIC